MKPEIVERNGERFVILPLAAFEKMVKDMQAFAANTQTDAQKVSRRPGDTPPEVAERLQAGENPLTIWREYRGMTLLKLSMAAETSRGMITEMESGAKQGGIKTLRKLARALDITIEDLLEDEAAQN